MNSRYVVLHFCKVLFQISHRSCFNDCYSHSLRISTPLSLYLSLSLLSISLSPPFSSLYLSPSFSLFPSRSNALHTMFFRALTIGHTIHSCPSCDCDEVTDLLGFKDCPILSSGGGGPVSVVRDCGMLSHVSPPLHRCLCTAHPSGRRFSEHQQSHVDRYR